MKKQWKKIVTGTSIFVMGMLSGYLAVADKAQIETYKKLKLPDFAPPQWLFSPVWIVLYAMLGYLGAKLLFDKKWKEFDISNHTLSIAFIAGLIVNYLWSYVFFSQANYLVSLWMIIFIFIANIKAMSVYTYQHKLLEASMLAIYLIWIGFATALNLSIYILN